MTEKKGGKTIQSVQRAIDILELFNNQDNELSLAEICKAVELNKSTAYGIIQTLFINEYLDKSPGNGKYLLGKALLSKASLDYTLLTSRLSELGEPYMRECVDEFHFTCSLFAYYRFKLTCLNMLTPSTAYGVVPPFSGKSLAFHSAASGKLVLSCWKNKEIDSYIEHNTLAKYTEKTITEPEDLKKHLKLIREQGFAVEDDEIQVGIYSIAAPIMRKGNLVGTLSLTGSTEAIKKETSDIAVYLSEATKKISEQL